MEQEATRKILDRFMNIPVIDGAEVFRIFAALPGAVFAEGEQALQRYVFVPGTKRNAVVLVAHADTVWDKAYEKPAHSSVEFRDGVYCSTNSCCGIGADDRAGCAMLWALRNSGHSLLVVDGEEHGKFGARFLRKKNKKLFRRLNRHCFMIELDWKGTGGCLFNQVENTAVFKNYIAQGLGFHEDDNKGGCDLQFLCRDICGVNIGVGYHNYHRATEYLDPAEWENTLQKLSDFLEIEHPKFSIPISKRAKVLFKKGKESFGDILRKMKILK